MTKNKFNVKNRATALHQIYQYLPENQTITLVQTPGAVQRILRT